MSRGSPNRPMTMGNPQSTYPIVLGCGIARFDRFDRKYLSTDNGDDKFHYFKQIRSFLIGAGFCVYHTTVNWGGRVATRAADLRREVESVLVRTGAPKVHIIAHSMGGLDARWMIAELDGDQCVCSLTTIGTAHHGTSVADWSLAEGRFGQIIIDGLDAWGIDLTGAYDLTRRAAQERNARLAPKERNNGVAYRAWAGWSGLWSTFLPLKIGYVVMKYKYGEPCNDGLVALDSARWRDESFAGMVPWDHLNQIGWWSPSRAAALDPAPVRFERSVRRFYLERAYGLERLQ